MFLYTEILQHWVDKYGTLSLDEFREFTKSQLYLDPFMDIMGGKYCLQAMQIQCYTYGSWQSCHEIHSCPTGLLKLLGKFDYSKILAQTEIDQILNGESPGKWKSNRHFGIDKKYEDPLDVACICGPWYRHGHFVTFVLCPEYWTFFDPLTDESIIEPVIDQNVKNAIQSSYDSKGIKVPKLPGYRQLKRICIQKDEPLSPWSCGTFALLTTFHLLLGNKLPHDIPPNSISRIQMLNLHKGLLEWLLLGKPPNLWDINCLNRSVVEGDPLVMFKYGLRAGHGGLLNYLSVNVF